MYELYYNFTAEPFRLSPDHRFCFEHKSYGKARAYMAYAFKRAEGFVMITGRPGTGKTTLIGELVESLSKDKVVTANLVCTQLQADDLLKTVAYSFGISPAQVGKAELLQRLNTLLHRWHREGRRALLVVDEAQDLSSSAMEELRLLTNIQFGGQPLLQIFLLGQPELRDLILSAEMEQVHQRIVAASHIEGLEEDETEAYVLHRLSVVGWQGNPAIDRAIFPYIHKFSEGVPRRINLICSRLFLLGSVEERDSIGVADVRVVIGELQAENLAAGTGISQADFHHRAEPQWAPVPVNESQRLPQPDLQAVQSASNSAGENSPEKPVETKKKDIPSFEPLVKSVPDSESGIPSVPVVHFEFVAEDDQAADKSSNDDVIVPQHDLVAPSEDVSSFVTTSGGAVASAAPRKRLMVMSLLMLVTIVLILLLRNCFVTPGGAALREPEQWTPVDDGQTMIARLVGEQVPAEVDVSRAQESLRSGSRREPDASLGAPVPEISGDQQELMPKVLEVGQRPIPVAATTATENIPSGESLPDFGSSSPNKAVAADASFLDDRDAAPAETAAAHDRQETILISFPFDSDTLIPDSHLALDRAAMMLRENAASVAAITGFTDNQGGSQYNLVLSRKRARAVERYLVEAGIARERLQVEGRGVLTDPLEGQNSGTDDSPEPYRIVQIKLGRGG